MARGRAIRILIVEDNRADIRLMQEAFRTSDLRSRLSFVRDGQEALDFLRRRGRHNSAPRPDLVVLDLNLPKRDGREVLAEIKNDRELCNLPVIVLSTSTRDDDVRATYALSGNCFIAKPVELDRFIDVVQRIVSFWADVATLPGHTAP